LTVSSLLLTVHWFCLLRRFAKKRINAGETPAHKDGRALVTQGEDIDEATENAREALALYVEGLREEGRSVGSGIVRRRLAVPA
jgi:hypothetical protein